MSRADAYEQPLLSSREELRRRGVTPKQRENGLRNLGYAAGLAGKAPTEEQRREPSFMASWRRGKEERTRRTSE